MTFLTAACGREERGVVRSACSAPAAGEHAAGADGLRPQLTCATLGAPGKTSYEEID
jgi:hypothetical protein